MAAELGRSMWSVQRAALSRSRHLLMAAADVASTGSGHLLRAARTPPVELRPLGGWQLPSREALRTGVDVMARGVLVRGLRLDRVTIRLTDVSLRPGRPLALRAGRITARAILAEPDVNSWLADAHLPLRLRFSESGIQTRAGMAGIALGTMDVDVSLDAGVLWLSPQRVAVLGIGLSTAALPPTPLPLPPLPRSAQLVDLRTGVGLLTVTLAMQATTVQLGPGAVRHGLSLVRSGRASIGAPPRVPRPRSSASRPDVDRNGLTSDRMRMMSPRVCEEASLVRQEETP